MSKSTTEYINCQRFAIEVNGDIASLLPSSILQEQAGEQRTTDPQRGSLSLVLLTWITFAIGAGALLASFLDYVGVK